MGVIQDILRTMDYGPSPEGIEHVKAWLEEHEFLSRRGQQEIQEPLLYDYRTNVELYPKWQATREGSEAYLKDLPHAAMHRLDAGEGTRLLSKEDAVGVSRKPHRRQL